MGIDFETLIILVVLAFILFGPEKLPEYAATLGKFVAKLRQATTEMTRQYQNPFEYPAEPTLPPAPSSTCPYCQQTVTLEFIFCPKCGHRLGEDHYPPPPQPLEPVRQTEPSLSAEAPRPAPLIRPLQPDEIDRALAIINQAALAYKGVIPADCWQEPYMPAAELRAEIAAGVDFFGCVGPGGLLGQKNREGPQSRTHLHHPVLGAKFQGRDNPPGLMRMNEKILAPGLFRPQAETLQDGLRG